MLSHVNLNEFGLRGQIPPMEKKCYQWYYVNFLISEYLSCDQQSTIAIDATKISLTVFLYF